MKVILETQDPDRVVTPFDDKAVRETATETACQAMRMLRAEHRSMIDLLHDDLGQNLVAIRSFAAAIAEKHAGDGGDTAELAKIIGEAADSAYRRSYDLMQELRAQHAADDALETSLQACLASSGLRDRRIGSRVQVDPALAVLNPATRAMILRDVRSFVSFCKQLGTCERISIELQPALGRSERQLEMTLGYTGAFERVDGDDPLLKSLAERCIAIDGELIFSCDTGAGAFTLMLYFDPLPNGCAGAVPA